MGWLPPFFDYVPDQPQTEQALLGIALMLSIIPGAFHLLMGLLMYRYRITDRYYEHVKLGTLPA